VQKIQPQPADDITFVDSELSILVSIAAQYTLTDWCDSRSYRRKFACRLIGISSREVTLLAPVAGAVGGRVIAHCDEFGKLDGSITRLLDRGFVRILGKKEDVGRPMLYGTTLDFLRTFSLRDLSELPTLREFHELSEQQMATVDAQAPLPEGAPAPASEAQRSPFAPSPVELTPVDQDEEDELLEALDGATLAAARAGGAPPPGQGAEARAPDASEAQS